MSQIADAQEVQRHRPTRLRKAWCELTGGHDNVVNGAFRGDSCFAISLHCQRCEKQTMWHSVPRRAREADRG